MTTDIIRHNSDCAQGAREGIAMSEVPKNGKFSPQRHQNHGKLITQRIKPQRDWKKEACMSRSDRKRPYLGDNG